MKKIVLACQKGGVGKSTTAYTMAIGLYNQDHTVLMIDTDPQANLSFTAGLDVASVKDTLYDVFKGSIPIDAAINNIREGFDIITGGLNMVSADMEFTQTGREYMLKESIGSIESRYDYCIIDTAPHMGILTINALTATDSVIIPITADIYGLMGLTQLKGIIDSVKRYSNHNLRISGLLLTRYKGTNANKAMMKQAEHVAESFGTVLYETKIREATAVQESQILQSDIFAESSKARVTQDYRDFLKEFLESEG